jgi:hypothetical protein
LLRHEIRDDEPRNSSRLRKTENGSGPAIGLSRYTARSAHRGGRWAKSFQRPYRLPNCAFDILEMDVDALGTDNFEQVGEIRAAMIDSGIKAELVDDETASIRTAGDADRTAFLDLSHLSDD